MRGGVRVTPREDHGSNEPVNVTVTTADRVKWLQRRQTSELVRAAKSFLRTGLDLAQARSTEAGARQAAVANLAVSVELMLKARLTALSLGLLYVDLPVQLRVILADPSAVPDSYNVHRWLNFIEIGQYKTQKVEYCIGAWSVYGAATAPSKPYLTRVSELRDRSVHGVLPALDHYEVARVAYTALMMYVALHDYGTVSCRKDFLTDADTKLIDGFPQERLERLHKKIRAAKAQAQGLGEPVKSPEVEGWYEWATECPVCGSDAALEGECEFQPGNWIYDEYGSPPPWSEEVDWGELWFNAETLKCSGCGLELEDYEEIELAGVEVRYPREEDVPQWVEEHYELDRYDDDREPWH